MPRIRPVISGEISIADSMVWVPNSEQYIGNAVNQHIFPVGGLYQGDRIIVNLPFELFS